jgi:hypothetical protein
LGGGSQLALLVKICSRRLATTTYARSSIVLYMNSPTQLLLPSRRIIPLARAGNIAAEELPLPDDQMAEVAYEAFDKNWNAALAECEKNPNGPKQPKLFKVS